MVVEGKSTKEKGNDILRKVHIQQVLHYMRLPLAAKSQVHLGCTMVELLPSVAGCRLDGLFFKHG